MVAQEVVEQLHEDIAAAESSGDTAAAGRLRAELAVATESDGIGAEIQAAQAPSTPDPASIERAAEDLGPGSYEQNAEAADELPLGSAQDEVQEPPD
ncbi:hypothetical protein [Nocardia sp. NPDC057030]|uniref:hypothetical protein n=1 Tax=unclassified Nocardia TaxID=2637762 RepID=UPI0036253455